MSRSERHELIEVLTKVQTAQTGAIDSERLIIVLILLLDRDPHENKIHHLADAIERQTQTLFPDRVETIVLDNAGLHDNGPC